MANAHVALFTLTLFVAAVLVFSVQPMVAKMVLPAFGGAPAVWNTALVFFQASLLAGYGYAHLLSRLQQRRRQVVVHLAVMAAAAACLPIAVPFAPDATSDAVASPALSLLGLLIFAVGLPFAVVAATAPLVQHWFACTAHRQAHDPYFLYAASNLGSVLALLGYPLVVEPRLAVAAQAELWAMLYVATAGLILMCGLVAMRDRGHRARAIVARDDRAPGPAAAVGWPQRLAWLGCSAIPSALLIGVTNHITTDLAAAPMLWVGPLVLYLLTFVIAFARRPPVPHRRVAAVFPYALTLLAATFVAVEPAMLLLPLHLSVFFIAALLCHGNLARRRPEAKRLTSFYLHLSLGGVLGGMGAALLAPVLFNAVYEYPLALAAACLALPGRRQPSRSDLLVVAGIAVALVAGPAGHDAIGLTSGAALTGILIAAGAIVAFGRKERPAAFALAMAVVLATAAAGVHQADTLVRARSFFGVYRIVDTADGRYRLLMHGTTAHGAQSLDPVSRRESVSYYAADGPVAEMIARVQSATAAPRIGVVGLGAGSLACYVRPRDDWTFYEIDPLVVSLASDPRLFSFLADCAGETPIVVGDARQTLQREADEMFSLLVIDAFTSDSIPVHLLTAEALQLYADKLSANGVALLHISNRHLELEPVITRALSALKLAGRSGKKSEASGDRFSSAASHWIAIAQSEHALDRLDLSDRWQPIPAADGGAVWTDAHSNILSALRW